MSDVDMLDAVLAKDAALLAGVPAAALGSATPCPGWDVQVLVDHMIGWLQVFAASANGQEVEGDPSTFVSTAPVAEFEAAARDLVSGWRRGGVERAVPMIGAKLPVQMVLDMSLMEYVIHGCDLATATGQAVPFSDDEMLVTLDRARSTLPDDYRGEGKPFGVAIEVGPDAPVLDRLRGFMGRAV